MKYPLKEVLVELKLSAIIKGEIGVFAAKDIRKGENVCPSESHEEDIISKEEFTSLSADLQERIKKFTAGRPEGFLIDVGIDFNELPVSQFMNHSCEGNLGFDEEGEFIALRNISKGEELFYDYGLLEADPDFRLSCTCGTPSCRKKITGLDWKDPEFQKHNREHMYPDLRLPAQ